MKLSDWLETQYLLWKGDSKKTYTDFAVYLDVPNTSLSNWLNSGTKMRADTVSKIARKLGPEIYDVLGLDRPDANDPRSVLFTAGFPPELVERLLLAREEYSTELSKRGISTDSPEAREIIKTALARHGFHLTDVQ